jgi:hypothetical protein
VAVTPERSSLQSCGITVLDPSAHIGQRGATKVNSRTSRWFRWRPSFFGVGKAGSGSPGCSSLVSLFCRANSLFPPAHFPVLHMREMLMQLTEHKSRLQGREKTKWPN